MLNPLHPDIYELWKKMRS